MVTALQIELEAELDRHRRAVQSILSRVIGETVVDCEIPRGKYRGKKLSETPTSYLIFLYKSNDPPVARWVAPMRDSISRVLMERRAGKAAEPTAPERPDHRSPWEVVTTEKTSDWTGAPTPDGEAPWSEE